MQGIQAVFPDHEPVVYRSTIQGKVLSTSWTRYLGETAGGVHTFESFTEVDPAAMGAGGSMVLMCSRLDCDASLRPLRYRANTQGAHAEVRVEDQTLEITLPGGIVKSLPRGGAEWILEIYMVGFDALLFARLRAEGRLVDGVRVLELLLNQLLVVPYELTVMPDAEQRPDGARWYTSSWKEELLLDPGGRLVRSRVPAHGVETELVSPAPELPAWRHEPLWANLKLARYQPPNDPRFRLRDVVIPGSEVPLVGALTVPAGDGPFPAVLFLGGSGLHDRHGLMGEIDGGYHEIVDGLAAAGFAGLRFDKRGAGATARGGVDLGERGLLPHFADSRAALAYLLAQPEVDRSRVYLAGHSEGAQIALVLATEPQGPGASGPAGVVPAGVVLLAPAGRPMDEVMLAQTQAMAEQRGMTEEQTREQVDEARRFLELCKSGREIVQGEVPDLLFLGARTVPWLRDHLAYAARELIPRLRCPCLVLQGDKDFQVSGADELVKIARGAGVDASLRVLPGLDHSLKRVEGESTMADYWQDRRISPALLSELKAWLRARAGLPELP